VNEQLLVASNCEMLVG
jgi:hypothetical protein